MCEFFSFRSDGNGKYFFLNAEQRREARAAGENPDSHTYIAMVYGFRGEDDDLLNRYEFNPFTGVFNVDTIVNYTTMNDAEAAGAWVRGLDFYEMFPDEMGFKAGTRVRCTEEYDDNTKIVNEIGTVTRNWSSSCNSTVLVIFDNDIDGHAQGGDGTDGRCWWVSIDKLEAIKEDEK